MRPAGSAPVEPISSTASVPSLSLGRLFLRFLRFGALAWGGPVAQIAMLKRELVDEEKWITQERFRQQLAVYQVLPGPEAHELCVYFGMLARGRIGGLLAGLGFMLPGLLLILTLSWAYTGSGSMPPAALAAFVGMQAGVVALIVRATHRIAQHSLTNRWLCAIALVAAIADLLGVHFAVSLACAGAIHCAARERHLVVVGIAAAAWVAVAAWMVATAGASDVSLPAEPASTTVPSLATILAAGLRAGLLTFGGAYTAISFLEADAVGPNGWMTTTTFLDGVALSGVLPAPLVIFGTFVGWIGRGLLGALVITAGIFGPAFGFTLVAHDLLERVVQRPRVREVLDGVTAGVVGLIAATAIKLAPAALSSVPRVAIAAVTLAMLYMLKSRLAVLYVMLTAAAAGWLFCR